MTDAPKKLVTLEQLLELRQQWKEEHQQLVQCHGCFDIVHPGHIRYLKFAKRQGDLLLVSISADSVVNKGYERPYINEMLRAENLASFDFVDYVYIDRHDWAGPVLEDVKPDIYVKGKEYENNQHPAFLREKKLVESYGGKVLFSSGDVVYSSSFIIQQFQERFKLEQTKINFFCEQNDISLKQIEDCLTRFQNNKVLVLGAPIVDSYIHSDVSGVAAESPIMSVTPFHTEHYVGGAGLVACQIKALGAQATLFSAFNERHPHITKIYELLNEFHVPLHCLHIDNRPIYEKKRYIVENKKLLKVNEGSSFPLSTLEHQAFLEKLENVLPDFDAVVLTDFGYGMFGDDLVNKLLELFHEKKVLYYADVSSLGKSNVLKFKKSRTAFPTEQELRFCLGDTESGLSNLASRFFQTTGNHSLILTLGKKGAMAFLNEPNEKDHLPTYYLPSLAGHVMDTVGAGDSLLAVYMLSDLLGNSLPMSLYLGVALASLKVMQMGNSPLPLSEFYSFLESRPELRPEPK